MNLTQILALLFLIQKSLENYIICSFLSQALRQCLQKVDQMVFIISKRILCDNTFVKLYYTMFYGFLFHLIPENIN